MTFGSLFAGIGGMDLGLERAGMTCKWQVEIDPYARRVLAKHWPDIPKHDDVKTFPPTNPEDWHVDLIAGGFPCQDISFAGKGAGLKGKKSGLWYEFARVIGELRPRIVLVENVSALLVRGMGDVLGTLASLGYDAEWGSFQAAAIGAPHLRDRVFILAYDASRGEKISVFGSCNKREAFKSLGRFRSLEERIKAWRWNMATVPAMVRAIDGVSRSVDESRKRGIGNAVVPQVAEWIGRRIVSSLNSNPIT